MLSLDLGKALKGLDSAVKFGYRRRVRSESSQRAVAAIAG
jgi:hypothetical protein